MDTRACTDDDRFLHEPRALWTVQKVTAPAAATSRLDGRVKVNKDHLRNVTRYPVTLTHLLVCAIGYTFREYAATDTTVLKGNQNAMNVANLIDVALAAPFSRHFARKDMRISALPAKPTGEPSYRQVVDYASGLWGLNRWTFDRPLILPRKATIQLDVGPFTVPDIGFAYTAGALDSKHATAYTSVSIEEAHTGKFGGSNRYREWTEQKVAGNLGDTSRYLFSDAFGRVKTGAQVEKFTPQEWPDTGLFPYKTFATQESNRGAETNTFTGFSVAVDQIDYDENIQGFASTYRDDPIAPLATRMIARARTSSGGSGEWWWRAGAPLALVAPTIGPAQCYLLPEPITLGPGEALEGEIQVPVAHENTNGDGTLAPTYTVGLSLTGYASIERL